MIPLSPNPIFGGGRAPPLIPLSPASYADAEPGSTQPRTTSLGSLVPPQKIGWLEWRRMNGVLLALFIAGLRLSCWLDSRLMSDGGVLTLTATRHRFFLPIPFSVSSTALPFLVLIHRFLFRFVSHLVLFRWFNLLFVLSPRLILLSLLPVVLFVHAMLTV